MKRSFFAPIVFFALLLLPSSALASTTEIRELESFHNLAEKQQKLPISDADRQKELEMLNLLYERARLSSERLLQQQTAKVDQILQSEINIINSNAKNQIASIEASYKKEVAAIDARANASLRKLKSSFADTVNRINQEARQRLARCGANASCRKAVESWRQREIATTTALYNREVAVVESQRKSALKNAQARKENAVREVIRAQQQLIAEARNRHSVAVARLLAENTARINYIKKLSLSAEGFINARPADNYSIN